MHDDDLTREDRLIHRTLDGSAGVGDWAELELLARRDPAVWKRLALAMRGELTLRRVGGALDAQLPDLPGRGGVEGRRGPLLVGGLGWAAALLVGFLWLGSAITAGIDGPTSPTNLELGADAAWAHYLASGTPDGRLIRELPPVMLEAIPDRDGRQVEVTFLRRAVERAIVDEVIEVDEDDAGRLVSRPVPIEQLVAGDSL